MAASHRVSLLVSLAAFALLLAPPPLAATALTPFIDLQEAGLTTTTDGEGLQTWDHTTPVDLTVNVGGTVRFALLYWAGSEYPCNFVDPDCTFVEPFDDQQMIFAGTPITGTEIGTETWEDNPGGERLAIGYFADVTSLVSAAGVGLHDFTFADGNLAANLTELDGVSLIVGYTDPIESAFYRVLVSDGVDFASGLAAPGENRNTSAVTFNHGSYPEPREAELTLVVGDGDASCDRVTISDEPDLINTLDASSGPDWDHDVRTIEIPADDGTTQVQVFAEPDDVIWQVAMLRVLAPQPTREPLLAQLGLAPTTAGGQVDSEPPTCTITHDLGPPAVATDTIQDTGSGLAEIVVTVSENADTVVPPFTVGTIDPVVTTSTKIDQTQAMRVDIRVTDSAGNQTTCTYREGFLTIVKDTAPDDPQDFDFLGSQSLGAFELDDEGGGDATLPSSESFFVPVGSYCVSEAVAPGFELVSIVCSDPTTNSTGDVPNRTAHVDLAEEDVTCTFTNTLAPSTLIIVKETMPDGPQDFAFTGTAPIGAFTLDDDAGADATFSNSGSFQLPPGAYTVTEGAVPGFTLSGIVCSDADSVGDPLTRSAAVALAEGETVTCTFTNLAPGTLTIVKDTVPDDPQDFPFTGTAPIGAFTLDDDGATDPTFSSSASFVLPAGSYTVTEGAVAGFDLSAITCDESDSVGDPATRSAAVALDPGDDVTCIFTNDLVPGTLTIVQDTVPNGPQDFPFTGGAPIGAFSLDDDADPTLPSSASFVVPPGTHTVTQGSVPGFPLGTITCDDDDSAGDTSTGTLTAEVAPGETVTCTFTNFEQLGIAEIPTLGEWAAMLLGLALAGLAAWRLRAIA